jgi:hypothetical protein
MNANNAYKIYVCLYKKHHPGRESMELRHCITNLTHSLLQQGPSMRERSSGPPPNAVDSFQAMLPYMGAKKGVLFYGGVSPSKIGLIAPY